MRQAIIETVTGKVANVIEAGAGHPVASGHELRPAGDAAPGDTWDGTRFVKPVQPVLTPDEAREADAVRALGASPLREALVDTILDHENRLRALERVATITRVQARAALKARIKAHL